MKMIKMAVVDPFNLGLVFNPRNSEAYNRNTCTSGKSKVNDTTTRLLRSQER